MMLKLHRHTILTLPLPPSVNNYYVKTRFNVRIGPEGLKYRYQVKQRVGPNPETLNGRLAVTVWAWMPDNRVRDLDNLLKCLLDACTQAGVWHDDNQIRRLTIEDRGKADYGKVLLKIREIDKQAMLFT